MLFLSDSLLPIDTHWRGCPNGTTRTVAVAAGREKADGGGSEQGQGGRDGGDSSAAAGHAIQP